MKKIINLCVALVASTLLYAQPAGYLDTNFNSTGFKVISVSNQTDRGNAMDIQQDGKIVIAGYTISQFNGKDFLCIRLNVDGTLDQTFGNAGIFSLDVQPGAIDEVIGVEILADGKIILGGSSDDGIDTDAAIVKLNADGTIDQTFGTNGISIIDINNSSPDVITSMGVQHSSGKIILGGGIEKSPTSVRPVLIRVDSDGLLDPSFNTTGVRFLDVTQFDSVSSIPINDIVVESNGRITAVGKFVSSPSGTSSDYYAARVLATGQMDQTFNVDGRRNYHFLSGKEELTGLTLGPNGKIYAIGYLDSSTEKTKLLVIENSSNPENSSVNVHSTLGGRVPHQIIFDNNGDLIAIGKSTGFPSANGFISKMNTVGTSNENFNKTGTVYEDFGFGGSSSIDQIGFLDVMVDANNDIITVGFVENDIVVARFEGTEKPDLNDFYLLSPHDGEADLFTKEVKLDISNAFLPDGYQFEIDTTNDFSGTPVVYNSSLSIISLQDLIPNTTYYWRARSFDDVDTGDYSATWSFTTHDEIVRLNSPNNNSIGENFYNLVTSWSPHLSTDDYYVEIDTNSNFTNPTIRYSTNASTTFNDLEPETKYFWRVQKRNYGGIDFGYSEVRNFTTRGLEDINLIKPFNFQTGTSTYSVELIWGHIPGVNVYQVEYSTSPIFSNSIKLVSDDNDIYIYQLEELTTYYWRVRSSIDGTNFGGYSETREFTTGTGLGIDQNSLSKILLFPNPTKDVLQIKVKSEVLGQEFSIQDINGKTLIQSKIEKELTQINLNSLSSGVYLFSIPENGTRIRVIKE